MRRGQFHLNAHCAVAGGRFTFERQFLTSKSSYLRRKNTAAVVENVRRHSGSRGTAECAEREGFALTLIISSLPYCKNPILYTRQFDTSIRTAAYCLCHSVLAAGPPTHKWRPY